MTDVTQFIIRRLLVTIPVLFGIVFIVFVLARILPGDPCRAVLGERATDEVVQRLHRAHGPRPADPRPVRDLRHRTACAGRPRNVVPSSTRGPVTELLVERLPDDDRADDLRAHVRDRRSASRSASISAVRRNSAADVGHHGRSPTSACRSRVRARPAAGLRVRDRPQGHAVRAAAVRPAQPGVTVVPLAVVWGLEDLTGAPRGTSSTSCRTCTRSTALITLQLDSASTDAFRHLILPAIALGTIPLAIIARITRSSLLDVLGLDYVRTARAKGLAERAVLLRHALRNATAARS